MSVTGAFTRRTLRANRVRTAVTIAGIALSAALLAAVLTALTSLSSFLYEQEKSTQGAWHASVTQVTDDQIERARTDNRIAGLSVLVEMGYAELSAVEATMYGPYLPVQAIDVKFGELCALDLIEGRLPVAPDEIVLPYHYQESTVFSDAPCAVGGTIELALGKRQAVAAPGGPADAIDGLPEYLDASFGYLDPENGDEYGEQLVESAPARAYTVVGFYGQTNMVSATSAGATGFTFAGAEAADARGEAGAGPDAGEAGARGEAAPTFPKTVYLITQGLSKATDVDHVVGELFDGAHVRLHDSLLRFAGMSDGRAIWDTLYQMFAVLAVVIVVASVALISNSFAISVAERTRQFGLIASIGASKLQIRRMVLGEAALLALVGAPLGILVGIGGIAVVLAALSPLLAKILGGVVFNLHVEAWALAVVAVLTGIVVLASAWLPAHRAARISPVDAIRGTRDVRPEATKPAHGVRKAHKGGPVDAGGLWKPRGIDLGTRIMGVPGALAHRAAKRKRGKGRAATASLFLATVLLITAGALSLYLSTATNVIGGTRSYDVFMFTAFGSTERDDLPAIYEEMSSVEGVEGVGFALTQTAPATIPASLAGEGLFRTGRAYHVRPADNAVETLVDLVFINDAEYRSYLEDQGLNVDRFMDAEHPLALANRQVAFNDGATYGIGDAFTGTGNVEMYGYPALENSDRPLPGETVLPDGQLGIATFDADGNQTGTVTRAEGAELRATVEVGALVDRFPAVMAKNASSPSLILPLSAAETLGLTGTVMFTAGFNADHHAEATVAIAQIGDRVFGNPAVADVAAEQERTTLLVTVIDVFSFSFAGILALIAIANVFNTMVNSLILRRREFAVLRSAGMDARAFRRMIAWECLGFGAKGLVAGLIVSIGVAYVLFVALEHSITGLTFALPWAHIAMSIAVVIAVMVIATAYGLRRSRSETIAEDLRATAL